MNKITSAYNFVPLAPYVFAPDWHAEVSQDIPFKDGYSGTIPFTITAHTPVLPGTNIDGVIEHFRLPDGTAAIPGSTLRGMIRSVLEIVSFGKMKQVDDKHYSVRDLTSGAREIYGNKFTHSYSREKKLKPVQGPFKALSQAGWLKFDPNDGLWKIEPADMLRVDKDELERLSKNQWWTFCGVKKNAPQAASKYQWWDKHVGFFKVDCDVGAEKDHKHSPAGKPPVPKYLRYRKATNLKKGSAAQLIFTGQPGPGKHMEFLFVEKESPELTVSAYVMRGFRQIYIDQPDDNATSKNNKQEIAHYAFLKNRVGVSGKIPVFYLLNTQGGVESLGLSLMYKLPYTHSIGSSIDNISEDHQSSSCHDLAELIFGTVDDKDSSRTLKGRVSVALARGSKIPDAYKNQQPKSTILNSPKPTYYPNYIVQPGNNGKLGAQQYRTLMDGSAQIRGWKRYPVSEQSKIVPPEEGQKESVQSKLKPLKGQTYQSKLRFHNLKKEELGALLWVMSWGGDNRLRHSLGMGKSMGLGQVSLAIDWDSEAIIANNPDIDTVPEQQDFVDSFKELMHLKIANWDACDQMVQLKSMADPDKGDRLQLKAMRLGDGPRNNEFTQAKGAGKSDKLVLSPHELHPGESIEILKSADAAWLEETIATLAANNNSDEKTVIRGRLLANEWQGITDDDLKAQVLELIKEKWRVIDSWEGPHTGGARKKAYAIYSAQSESNQS